jgi:hypothetical protein
VADIVGSRDLDQRLMSVRQLSRLLKLWIIEAELKSSDYSVESLRRTKALHILRGTGDLQVVRALLAMCKLRAPPGIWVSHQNPTRSRSVEPSTSNVVGTSYRRQRAVALTLATRVMSPVPVRSVHLPGRVTCSGSGRMRRTSAAHPRIAVVPADGRRR